MDPAAQATSTRYELVTVAPFLEHMGQTGPSHFQSASRFRA
jgi:hypothetical protein